MGYLMSGRGGGKKKQDFTSVAKVKKLFLKKKFEGSIKRMTEKVGI